MKSNRNLHLYKLLNFLHLKNDMCFMTETIHKLQTHVVYIVKQLGLNLTESLDATNPSLELLNSESMDNGNQDRLPKRVVVPECHPSHSDEVYHLHQPSPCEGLDQLNT